MTTAPRHWIIELLRTLFAPEWPQPPQSTWSSSAPGLPQQPETAPKNISILSSATTAAAHTLPTNGQATGTTQKPPFPDEKTLLTVLGADSKAGENVTLSL